MNKKIVFIIVTALIVGFLIGWIMKPNVNQEVNQTKEVDSVTLSEMIYTCSMHPQIRQNEPGDCPICGMDLIPLDNSQADSEHLGFQMTQDAIQLANIQTQVVGMSDGNSNSVLKLNGKIMADESRSSSLVSHIPGRIERLYISFTGEEIYKGQKIASIYSPDLIVAQKELIEASKMSDLSPKILEAAKNKLKYWKVDNATIESILTKNEIKENFDIYSEYSGVVTMKKVSVGDYINKGSVMFSLDNLTSVWALFDIYETNKSKVKVGDKVSFTSSGDSKRYEAIISFLNPIIDPKTRVFTARAEVKNTGKKLKPEMFITGTINAANKSKSELIIPKTAILWTGQRSVVYIKEPEVAIPTFEYREVILGDVIGKGYKVIEGITLGEEIVTNGAFVIDAAAQLNNHVSMMNKNVTLINKEPNIELPDFRDIVPVKFKKQLAEYLDSYLEIKNSLVETNTEKTRNAAIVANNKILEIDMSLLNGESHDFWMKNFNTLKSHNEKIATSKDVDEQRSQFQYLSAQIIETIKIFGISETSDTVYVQHCPMAFNDGADWLSKNPIIQNPYFGEKMMKCGVNRDTIIPTNNNKKISN